MVRKETVQAIPPPAPLLDRKRSCEQWESEHHTTPFSRGSIMVVGERIPQSEMWSAAVADVVVVAAAAGCGVVVVPSLVGLVAQYVLGLSPVGIKLWNYSTALLFSNQLSPPHY
jgi:DNA-binding transcriptional LysR family regulator